MSFTLQGVGPFLHWLTLAILAIAPVLIAYVIYTLGNLPRLDCKITRPPASRSDQHMRLDGHHHSGAMANCIGLGLSGAKLSDVSPHGTF